MREKESIIFCFNCFFSFHAQGFGRALSMILSLLSGVVHRGFRCARGICLFGVIAISSRGWKRVDVEERPRKADIGGTGEER